MKYRITPLITAGALLLGLCSCSVRKNENLFDDEFTDKIVPVELVESYNRPEIGLDSVKTEDPIVNLNKETEKSEHRINMNCVMQLPELPTGCEVTALTSVLNYLEYDVTKTELAKNYLTTAALGSTGFDKAFIGNPASDGGLHFKLFLYDLFHGKEGDQKRVLAGQPWFSGHSPVMGRSDAMRDQGYDVYRAVCFLSGPQRKTAAG